MGLKKVIVLLPGLDGTGDLFQPFLPAISEYFRPIVVGYPERGEIQDYLSLLKVITKSLPADEKFIVLGESFSGPLAVMLAHLNPAGLEAIVLCATFIRNPRRVPAWMLRPLIPLLLSHKPGRFSQKLAAKVLFGSSASPELHKSLADVMGKVDPEVMRYRVGQILQVDVSSQLALCPVPVLYLQGKYDLVVPKHNAKMIKKILPCTKDVTLPSPHLVLQTHAKAAAEEIYRFYQNKP